LTSAFGTADSTSDAIVSSLQSRALTDAPRAFAVRTRTHRTAAVCTLRAASIACELRRSARCVLHAAADGWRRSAAPDALQLIQH
jgi:hypothetical protein